MQYPLYHNNFPLQKKVSFFNFQTWIMFFNFSHQTTEKPLEKSDQHNYVVAKDFNRVARLIHNKR